MAGSETYTTPADFTNGETVNDTKLNQQVRDNITYLKGVLTGSNLQNIVCNVAKLLLWGALAVLRAQDATLRHLSCGYVYTGVLTANVTFESAVTFSPAFSSVPVVTFGQSVNSDIPSHVSYGVKASTLTTTGFTLQVHTAEDNKITTVFWIATGSS